MTISAKKTFHMFLEPGKSPVLCLPWSEEDKEKGVKFDPDKHFNVKYQVSNFMELFHDGTYGEITVSLPVAKDPISGRRVPTRELLSNTLDLYLGLMPGVYSKKFPVNETHKVIYGDFMDNRGTAIVVPKSSKVNTLEDLGLHLNINKESDKPKVRKYTKRVKAPHDWAITGTVKDVDGDVITVECGNLTFKILHVDISKMDPKNEALADGVHVIEVGLAQALGEEFGIDYLKRARTGLAFKGTMVSRIGVGKGFYHIMPSDSMTVYGMVIYGPKTLVKFDEFFFGSLGAVKGGPARTCIQSMGSFINESNMDMWYDQAKLHMLEVYDSIHNSSKLAATLLKNAPRQEDIDNDPNSEPWILLEALKRGLAVTKFPGLQRKVAGYLLSSVMDCKTARIPYGAKAYRFHLQPDFNCFNFDTGDVDHTKSIIPKGAVCCMDLPQGMLAMYRQPLGNAKEAVVAVNLHKRRANRYIGQHRIILGVEAYLQYKTMGGADGDDSVVATSDISWVEQVAKSDYPLTPLPKAVKSEPEEEEENEWMTGDLTIGGKKYERKMLVPKYPRVWSMYDYEDAARQATKMEMTIGIIDNGGRLDMLLSGAHKKNMLKYLSAQIDKCVNEDNKATLAKCYMWLEEREDYQLREVMSSLESFIDYAKMGKGDQNVLAGLQERILNVLRESKVYPICWSWLGGTKENPGRLPANYIKNVDYVLAPSLVCETLGKISKEQDMMRDRLRGEEWLSVHPLPECLDNIYPKGSLFADQAYALRALWGQGWDPFIKGEFDPNLDSKTMRQVILNGGKLTTKKGEVLEFESIKDAFNEFNGGTPEDDFRPYVAIEIARQTYRQIYSEAPKDEITGFCRSFPDALLWVPFIGRAFLQALDNAGLTGIYVGVKLEKYAQNLIDSEIEVVTQCNLVVRATDGTILGEASDNVPDGTYWMRGGLLEIQQASIELNNGMYDPNMEKYNQPMCIDFDE